MVTMMTEEFVNDRISDTAREKARIRALVGERRRSLTPHRCLRIDHAVQERFLASDFLNGAQSVGCYMAMSREVDTSLIVRECRDRGCDLSVPAFDYKSGRYGMARMACDDGSEQEAEQNTVSGPMGIPQPTEIQWIDMGELDVVVVPGLAFDLRGVRLGHGGGHYDKMLEGVASGRPLKVALAFSWQIMDELPEGTYDVRVDFVVTENAVVDVDSFTKGRKAQE